MICRHPKLNENGREALPGFVRSSAFRRCDRTKGQQASSYLRLKAELRTSYLYLLRRHGDTETHGDGTFGSCGMAQENCISFEIAGVGQFQIAQLGARTFFPTPYLCVSVGKFSNLVRQEQLPCR